MIKPLRNQKQNTVSLIYKRQMNKQNFHDYHFDWLVAKYFLTFETKQVCILTTPRQHLIGSPSQYKR